jgi:tetratricopeptide (TPR) repeat protein
MAGPQPEAEAVQKHLNELLKSPGFARNERLSRFLRFIVARHLEGRDLELKESVIAIEVFGRKPDYSPKLDPIVRTEARRLRMRLNNYYEREGAQAAVIIDLPKGGYVPLVRFPEHAQVAAPSHESARALLRKWSLAASLLAAMTLVGAFMSGARMGAAHRSESFATAPVRDIYLQARAAEIRRACSGVEQGLEFFEQAIIKDPTFAPAYAGVASMEAARSGFDRFTPSERVAMIAKGWAAARKAIQLDPALPDVYDALGMMQARQAQWPQAEASFRRAIRLAPRDPLWRNHFALFLLLPLRRLDEAIEQEEIAEQLDPHFLDPHYVLNLALRAAGRFEEADAHCHRAAENDLQMSACWADTFLRQGRAAEAVQSVEIAFAGNLLNMGAESLGVAYARAGRRNDAERIAAIVPRPAEKAIIFAALGDKDSTFEILDRMLPMGPTRIGRDLISPEFAVLHGDARLAAIRKKLGLPE